MNIYKFGNYALNTTERRVLSKGKNIRLTTKAFDVLQLLVENAGSIVSKETLFERVWDGEIVEEGNLSVHISKIRKALADRSDRRFIETVHGTGYRFTQAVGHVVENEWPETLDEANTDYELDGTGGYSALVLMRFNTSGDADRVLRALSQNAAT